MEELKEEMREMNELNAQETQETQEKRSLRAALKRPYGGAEALSCSPTAGIADEVLDGTEASSCSPASEAVDECAKDNQEEPGSTDEEIAAMVAEAEQRGYLRGRNEIIGQMMREPSLFSNPVRVRIDESAENRSDSADPARDFLTHIRPQVWD